MRRESTNRSALEPGQPKSSAGVWIAAGGCGLVALFGCIICGGVGTWLYLRPPAGSLEGAWEYSGNAVPPNLRSVRVMSGKYLVNTIYDRDTKAMVLFTGASYTLQGDSYKEQVEFVSPGRQEVLLGKEQSFAVKVHKNSFDVTGVLTNGNPINESWTRLPGEASPLDGAWESITPDIRPELRIVKLIAGSQFTFVAYHRATKLTVFLHGGTCTVQGKDYTESFEYTRAGDPGELIGKQVTYAMDIQGDQMTVTGTLPKSVRRTETWRRMK